MSTSGNHSKTRPGTIPNSRSKTFKPGRNRPAKGYDPVTKTWKQHRKFAIKEK